MLAVQCTRELDVERIISELNIKSKKKGVEGKTYSVEVNRQLLQDAHDALKHYYDKEVKESDDVK